MSGLYTQNFSSARALSPHIRTAPDVESQYLTELLAEYQKLGPFMQVLPICSRLLNQEILRVSGMIPKQGFGDFDRLQRGSPSPLGSSEMMPNIRGTSFGGWNGLPHERLGGPQGMTMDWQAPPGSPSSYIVKKILRLEIPVDSYPNFNFVGRLLGPRGNSLKRVEASTGCRVYIRGKGSIKDPDKVILFSSLDTFAHQLGNLNSELDCRVVFSLYLSVFSYIFVYCLFTLKEEELRGRPGYEHLNDPLYILIEAELPVSIVDVQLRRAQEIIEELLKPVDESHDFYKRQQLRELALLNSNFREESPQPRGSASPFSSSGMKRAKTGR
ncbi:hypothetical protein PVL29_007811 [Vitis rotundifolia]|uniref:K Homology domain-containing protein n=1 Tax=Vitis rotundifolia TaxID=103349 RepID=A0AA39A2T9_VITRO|nr:hypothetical protein PVL29_007811 [Vitis rotundifolia]